MKNVDIRKMVVWLKMADGSMKPFFRAYLVAITFLENPHNYKQLKFKDGNLYNACADNLEWVESGGDIDEEGLVVNDNDNKRLSFQD